MRLHQWTKDLVHCRCAWLLATLAGVALAIGMTSVSVSYAIAPISVPGEEALPSPFDPFPSLQANVAPTAAELQVLTSLGISPALATRALDLQTKVAEAHLVGKIEEALGSSYAGVWLEPSKAQFDVGVASGANRKLLAHVIASSGLKADVVEKPVHSTWRALIARQERWSKRLGRLLGPRQVMTGIDVPANAVAVTISASASPSRRATLRREAVAEGVAVALQTAPRSQFPVPQAKKTCESPFVEDQAYCEETITSGVQVRAGSGACTAGPLLIRGTETLLLTAGHCIGGSTPAGGLERTLSITSAYPINGTQLQIGSRTKWYKNSERDIGEVKVVRPGAFTEPLPTPVPALVTEWKALPGIPHSVTGIKAAEISTPRQVVCHQGQTTGERCGLVLNLNAESGSGVKFLVETSACSDEGDSGGPYFFRNATTKELYMMGTHVAGTSGCTVTSPKTVFEPLLDTARSGLGILATFPGQRLLTKLNEVRRPRILGANGEPLVKKSYTSTSGADTIETVAGSKVHCTADSGSGEASGPSIGTATITFTECEGFTAKCHTEGAAEGEVVLSGKYTLVFINGSEAKVGLLLEPYEETIKCIKEAKTVETLKLRGTAIAPTTPLYEKVIPPKKFTLAFAQTNGVQEPQEYESEGGSKLKATLELEGSGSSTFAFEHAGLADTDELLFEETAEIEA